MSWRFNALVLTTILALGFSALATSEPRYVILLIGDGMDDSQITLARNYLKGAQGRLQMDSLPFRSSVQVITMSEQDPSKPVYVADSANTATTLATGQVTSRGRIATTAKTDKDLTTIAELAKAAGYATGIVTTASITDATPAAFISHIGLRGCQNSERMWTATSLDKSRQGCEADLKANGGKGSIAEQIAEGTTDLILGGGNKHFQIMAETTDQTVQSIAEANGYSVIHNTKVLQAMTGEEKILGLFARKTMEVKLRGKDDRKAEHPKRKIKNWLSWSPNTATLPEPMQCEANPDFANTPTLPTMTQAALDLLVKRGGDKGFFLMVESASIDKQAHRRNPCGQIGELEQLDDALKKALTFAKQHANTLILVTADHGHAAQIIPLRYALPKKLSTPDKAKFDKSKADIYSPGKVALLQTADDQIMVINYATNNASSADHTGTQVPLMSNQPLPGMMQQSEIFSIMQKYLQL
ncbi:alkaline phosphatase [Maricurvus nonylphenolicus]|uniref:alkaline phosphatase n=1 Tax=Maricurvus nonylphenolicus TaxID=1008307 RepID=UPI0036F35ECC